MRRVDVGSKKTRVIWKRIGRAGAVAKRARLDYGTVGAHGVMKNAYPSNRQAAIVPTAQENGKASNELQMNEDATPYPLLSGLAGSVRVHGRHVACELIRQLGGMSLHTAACSG